MKTDIKKVRLADIAAEAGVSTVTVAKALNRTGGKNARVGAATAARIREIATRLNYRPNSIAQQLKGKKSRIIGVVMDSCAPQVYHDRLSKMEMYAASKGYKLMIGQAHEDIQKIKDYALDLSSYGVDGIICMAHTYPEASFEIAELYNNMFKTVFLGRPNGGNNYYSVSIDIQLAFRRGVEYLAGKGRKNIALVLSSGFFQNMSTSIRELGYLEGVKECNPRIGGSLIRKIPIEHLMDDDKYLLVVQELFFDKRADAIIAGNDNMAAMVMKTISKLNLKVPADIAVMGCDNLDVARLICPTLTTFDQENDEVSKAIVDLLIARLKGKHIPVEKRNIIIKPRLIERESV